MKQLSSLSEIATTARGPAPDVGCLEALPAMREIYFDESIHDRGGFILGAYVCGADADAAVTDALSAAGLRPGVDEFKSSARMDQHPEQLQVREHLQAALRAYRIGVLVAPASPRSALGVAALKGLKKIVIANRLEGSALRAYFDEGIFTSAQAGREIASNIGMPTACELQFEHDSRIVKGLQLGPDPIRWTG